MSGLQGAFSIYEREVRLMPEKVSHVRNCGSLQVGKDELYSLIW